MLLSHKPIAIALAIALGTCTAVGHIYAQQLGTEVIPGESSKQTKPAASSAESKQVRHSSVALEKDSAASVGHHHYNSDAERAQDDLIITEVKSALADDGISDGYPVEVDADHGTVTLSGVVASAGDVRAAAGDAAGVRGVVAVKNHLKPH